MKMSTAPVENIISISANAATPQALAGATASSSQPAPQIGEAEQQAGPGADAAADAVAEHAREHGADAHAGVAEADRLLGQAERARREQDLDDDRRVVARLPAADGERQRDQQPVARDEAHAGVQVAPELARRVRPRRGSRAARAMRMPRRITAETMHHHGVDQQRQRRADELDQRAGQAGTGDLGARRGERVLRVRLDQPVARDDLRQDDLRGAAGDRVDRADARSRTT